MASTEIKVKDPFLVHDGYIYRFDRRSADNGKYWRCMKVGCYGRIKTHGEDVPVESRNTRHNHRSYPDTGDLEKVITAMQQSPESENVFCGDVDCQEGGSLSDLSTFAGTQSFTKVSVCMHCCDCNLLSLSTKTSMFELLLHYSTHV